MRRWLLLAAVAALTGCQSKPLEQMSYTEFKALAAEIQQRCYDQGATNRREFDICVQQEITREQSTRAANAQYRAGVARGLANTGAQMQANAAAQSVYRPPVRCTSTPGMNGVMRTTCY
jgi:hypothetical protein